MVARSSTWGHGALGPRPILPMGGLGPMPPSAPRPLAQPALIPQVLAVNAALISAMLLAATVIARLDLQLGRRARAPAPALRRRARHGPRQRLVLRRRFEPLERVIAAMEDVSFGARRRPAAHAGRRLGRGGPR